MKKSKRNYVLIALLVILIALAVGYAAFTQNLLITGTATGSGTWDVKFTEASIATTGHGTATIDGTDPTKMTVAAELAYPGDACTVTAKIKNNGNVAAKLTAFNLTKADGTTAYSDDNITITLPTIAVDGTEVIAAGETCTVVFTIKWNDASTAESISSNFKVNFTYDQSPAAVTVTPSHGTHE